MQFSGHVPAPFAHTGELLGAIYLIVLVAVGFYFSKEQYRDSSSYFLGNRGAGWVTLTLSLAATCIVAEFFLVRSQLGALGAWDGVIFGASIVGAILILAFVIGPKLSATGVMTVPEYLGGRYGVGVQFITSGTSILILTAFRLATILLVTRMLLGDWNGTAAHAWVFLAVTVSGVLAIAGGLRVVLHTQAFQAIVLVAGSTVLLVAAISGSQVVRPATGAILQPVSPSGLSTEGEWFVLLALLLWYWCADQTNLQRMFAARSPKDIRLALLGVASIVAVLLILFFGVYTLAIGAPNEDSILHTTNLPLDDLPSALEGVFSVSILASVMALLSATFHPTGTLITVDFYKTLDPTTTERKLVLVGRLATGVVVVLTILSVPALRTLNPDNDLAALVRAQVLIAAPIAVLLLLGSLWKGLNDKGALWSLIVSGVVALSCLFILRPGGSDRLSSILPHYEWFSRHSMAVLTVILVSLVVSVFVSLATGRVSERRPTRLAANGVMSEKERGG